ncbi:MAG TPA: lamin tail domain-containing protein [Verrucomicrobiae bacterium]|nr:lamin tail domain-containing protein [Verrucomicrobiae bacterium]
MAWAVPGQTAELVTITEFMAVNNGPLADEDGDFSDWIELHNGGTAPVNLDGWYLTDRASDLRQWRLPATNILANDYLIVFASGKNRRVPGAPLHTNFKLSSDGEYLALVRPDGTTIASAYGPAFPVQVGGVSYGQALQETATTLLTSGAPARFSVPANGLLGNSWTLQEFNDAAWSSVTTGVGFETDGSVPFVPTVIADSVAEFSGVQGQANWYYGYWNQTADDDGIYAATEFTPFPNAAGPPGPNNFWNGTSWDWYNGDPPYTQVTSTGGRPSGDEDGPAQPVHWAIRRYISEFDGSVNISGRLGQTSDWIRVTQTAIFPSNVTPLLYIYFTGAGEGYVDNVSLVAGSQPDVGANLVVNGDFENQNLPPAWTVSANLSGSATTTTIKRVGTRSLKVVSTSAGASQSTAIWQQIAGMTPGQLYTLSYWYLPTTNSPPLVVRFSQSWITTSPQPCGDGVIGRIMVDGKEVFRQLALGNTADYSITVPAHLGSAIDFVLDSGAASDGSCDTAIFTAKVATTDPTITVVADSVADWSFTGTQGENNWYYGYYNRSADPDRVYQAANFIPFPRSSGPQGTNNFWDEEEWDWFSGNPPFDKVGQYWMTPNGINNGAEHWVIRRWVSESAGNLTVEYAASKEYLDQYHTGGGGTIVRIFQNGVQRDSTPVGSNDVVGIRRAVSLNNVQIGDTIDIALDPTDASGIADDDQDRTFVTATIRGTINLSNEVTSDVRAQMQGINSSAYLRVPFNVVDPGVFNGLTLRLKYDDGFVAYLNGVEVARANAPLEPTWNSASTSSRSDAAARNFETWNIGASLGLLRAGQNVLAMQGLNASVDDGDFLLLPELIASTVAVDPGAPRYFMTPTPGAANGYGNTNLGPLVLSAAHSPNVPADNDNLSVTATVSPTFRPVGGVRLIYRTMYSNEVNVAMFDDGAHGDGLAGDGVWGGTIPASASNPGQMVRYYIYATDTGGNSTRFPPFPDPKNSPQYQGTVVFNPALTNPLPVVHFFVQNPTLATNYAGTRCSIFWDDEFLDNVEVNAHGQTTWFVFPKRSMDLNLNTGYKLRWKRGEDRVKAFDLLSTYGDRAYMRLLLAFETFRDAGVPTHFAFPVRLQENNAFNGVMHWVEQANDDFLQRNGLDPDGPLYKIYFPLTNAYSGVHKVTRKNEPNDDLQAMIDGLSTQDEVSLRAYLFDHLDVPEVVNFFATVELVQNEDCCWYKNYYLHQDRAGNGEWRIMPWDLDLTFGRTFTGWVGMYNQQNVLTNFTGGYFDTNIFWTNKWFTEQRALYDYIGLGQPMANAIFSFPDTLSMFYRRWSTVQEDFLQRTNTHPAIFGRYERRVDELASQILPDSILDQRVWGTWWPSQNMAQAVSIIKTQYFGPRRSWIFNTLAYANGGPYVGPQPTNAPLLIGNIEYNPSSGNQGQEYIQLINPNDFAMDVSGWIVSGGIQHTFKPGTVIASNGTLYLSPDVKAFRARASSPKGGQGLFVQGNYKGQLSAWGESVVISDRAGNVVRSTNYLGTPSLAQQYLRITEIMYHPPPPPPGLATNADSFEYIELRNTGPTTLNLAGVHFSAGIEFSFTGSAVTSLAPGQRVLIVKNRAAFVSRYGNSLLIAGAYLGSLDNGGENIRLDDATGEKILDFSYDNRWYRSTDGAGFSLVILDDEASWDTWGVAQSWRPSGAERGSPGVIDPDPLAIPAIRVNEVLSRTEPPAVDAIELYNPTAQSVNLRGWYLSDDFGVPKKFRVPTDVIIQPNGYVLFTEADFNAVPGSPTSFAFSSMGDEAYLFSGDANGNLTGYFHGFSFGAGETGVSFGRYVNSVGQEHFVAQTAYTPRAVNSGPRVGPVVVSEILFRPPDHVGGEDNSQDEYVALRNITASGVSLYDPARPANTWQLRGGVDYIFPQNQTLAANGTLVVVSFSPTDQPALNAFRARFGLPASVPVYGPYFGKLDNSSDAVSLYRPGVPDLTGVVPNILVERIDYEDAAPWPVGADGSGAALHRKTLSTYGNDPANWIAASPDFGLGPGGGTAPKIVSQPASQVGFLYHTTTFNVVASGSEPLRYQWFFNGDSIVDATNASLVLYDLHPNQVGTYAVTVYNRAGAVTSSNAVLTTGLPAYFLVTPRDVRLRGSTNDIDYGFTTNDATFQVAAVGNGPVSYQWRFNGATILGATSPTLVMPNVGLANDGLYDALVTDNTGTVPSPPARLTVLLSPTFVQVPLEQAVVSNGAFTATVVIRGNPPPFYYRWLEGGSAHASFATADLTNSYSFGPITNLNARNWRVIVTNEANTFSTAVATFPVYALVDADRDGVPDEWELNYGMNPADAADADQDADGDGMSNRAEYLAGTNPTDRSSYLKITEITTDGGASLKFVVPANKVYSVEFTDALGTGTWFKLSNVLPAGEDRVVTLQDPGFQPTRFYRLTTPPRP